jgi:hypothetical protein
MMPNRISIQRPSLEGVVEVPVLSNAGEDMALLFYALLDDEDLKEVFGEFRAPVESTQ